MSRIYSLMIAAAALFFSSSAFAEGIPLRICTGSPSGNYHFAATEVTNRLPPKMFNVTLINTDGSLDNLRRIMKNECDIAITQSDVNDLFTMENPAAMTTIQTYATLYQEYVHVLCPAVSGWKSIKDFRNGNGRMIVGPNGGGSAETWRALTNASENYKKTERLPDAIGIESARVVKDSKDTCMLWVSGLNSPDMSAANRMSVNTRDRKPALALIDVSDSDFKDVKNSSGKPMYQFADIAPVTPKDNVKGMYENLLFYGTFSKSVTVPTVDAQMVIRTDYKTTLGRQSGPIIQALEDAYPSISARVNNTQK